MILSHVVLLPLYVLYLNVVVFFECCLCTYDSAGRMDCTTVKENGSKNVIVIIMFHYTHTKSFSGHYDEAMLVVMSNTFESLH